MNRFLSPGWLLTLLVVSAFLLRAWQPGKMSIEHFDEGVYASNFFSDHLGFRYPDQHLYAPPLFPAVLEWTLILTGANPHAVMWVNVLMGTALVWGVWWTTREFARPSAVHAAPNRSTSEHAASASAEFTPAVAGLVAAALVAFSELFIQYSRATLTDIPVCLWMVLAVGAGLRGIRDSRFTWSAAAAVLTALAWWTKYNGWLPLAILGAGLGGWIVFTRPGKEAIVAGLSQFGVIAGGAALLWWPCLWDLQKYGGYSAVAANHRGYLGGWSQWGDSLLRQWSVDRYYAGVWTAACFCLAIWIASRLLMISPKNGPEGSASQTARLRGGVLALLPPLLTSVLGLAGSVATLLFAGLGVNAKAINPSVWLRRSLSFWVLVAWVTGLLLTTPLYRPYPRLMLPGLLGLIIATSVSLASAWARWRQSTGQQPAKEGGPKQAWGMRVCVIATFVLLGGLFVLSKPNPAWQDRRGLARVADEALKIARSDQRERQPVYGTDLDCLFYVMGEPGLYYHLAARDNEGPLRFIAQPASNLGMLEPGKSDRRITTYLITGPHSEQEAQQLQGDSRVVLAGELPYSPSDLVLLDNLPPASLDAHRQQTLQLWRVQTP